MKVLIVVMVAATTAFSIAGCGGGDDENSFDVSVTAGGEPVTDADVSVEFFMPAMPEMKMSEMRNTVPLTHAGDGRYQGTGNVMMSGNWDATVTVTRGGQVVSAEKFAITAK